MHERVAVEREPAAQARQSIGKVEAGVACARIVARELHRRRHVIEAGKGIPERPERQRHMPLPAEDVITSETELQIFRRLKADLLPEHVWPGRK